jgi:hypothetical protein
MLRNGGLQMKSLSIRIGLVVALVTMSGVASAQTSSF